MSNKVFSFSVALLQPFFSHLFISTYFLKDPILFKVAHSDQVIFMFFRSLINFMISAQNILKLFEYYMKLLICIQLLGLYNWILSRYTLLAIIIFTINYMFILNEIFKFIIASLSYTLLMWTSITIYYYVAIFLYLNLNLILPLIGMVLKIKWWIWWNQLLDTGKFKHETD
jgi:hypothetical protein